VLAVPLEKEVIIVDDGSTDGTTICLKEIEKERLPGVKIIFKEKNEGKGSAVRTGINLATGEIIIIQDADLEYEPLDYLVLIKPIQEGRAKVVYGSRILSRSAKSSLGFYLGGRLLTLLANLIYGIKITDEPTGYKVFASSVIKKLRLKENGFAFCPEVTARIARAGYQITEVPIHYHPRSRKEGKKIKPIDGLKAIWSLVKYRFCD